MNNQQTSHIIKIYIKIIFFFQIGPFGALSDNISTSIKKYGGIMAKILGQCFLSNSWDKFEQIKLSNPQNTTVNNLRDFSETQDKIIHGKVGVNYFEM